jgi:phosphate starvation-inducible PhoH-like protein
MSSKTTLHFTLTPVDSQRLLNLCGEYNKNLKTIEKHLGITINNRGHDFTIIGSKDAVKQAQQIVEQLYQATANQAFLESKDIHLALYNIETNEKETSMHTAYGSIKPRSKNQQLYIDNITTHDISFGIGPAGTGKTYLAVACAIAALEKDEVRRIVLVRPAVEAGERLGFLPGDLAQKVDPYLRPLYDALYEMLGFERVNQFLTKNIIEIAPLAYMRGRTLNDAFIILDESQNTTPKQMKMFLTRIGFNSKAIITGDVTQIDLAQAKPSGLLQVMEILKDIQGISFTSFKPKDIVRHALVQKIVEAYEKYSD